MSLYQVLTLVVVSALLGMFLGFWVFATAINWCIRVGVMDVFIKVTRQERFRMWQ